MVPLQGQASQPEDIIGKVEYEYKQALERPIGFYRGFFIYLGHLDERGNFVPLPFRKPIDFRKGGSGPDYTVINAIYVETKTEQVYEYRSGVLVKGTMDEKGNFIPEIGSAMLLFKDYRYGKGALRIYNLPGKFQRKWDIMAVDSIRNLLSSSIDPESMRREVEAWKKGPLYQVASGAQYLLPFLLKWEFAEAGRYRWQEGQHNLNQVEGRAAFALEILLGIKLSIITPGSIQEDRMKVHQEAKRAVENFLTLAMKTSAATKTEKIEVLKARYHGKIKAGKRDGKGLEYHKTMYKLLLEWPPLGRKLSDLQEIIGDLGESELGYVRYHFGNGLGVEYIIRTKDGLISSVLMYGRD